MNHVVAGYGEIGHAVHGIVGPNTYIVDLNMPKDRRNPFDVISILHICFPYSKDFNKAVRDYIDIYNPQHVIIWSTVPIGTSKEISPRIIHSPVEGKHPDLEMSIRQMERWVGFNDRNEGVAVATHLSDLGLRTKLVRNTDFTEALKLLSTTEYGINIVFAAYKAKVAEAIGMDYKLAKEWNEEYNKLYKNLGMEKRFQKFVLDAPTGRIGGHCIVPNAEILQEVFPDVMLEKIIKLGEEK